MTRYHAMNVVLSLSLWGVPVHARHAVPVLPEQVQAEHSAAMAAYQRGEDRAALRGFLGAYAGLPDPIADRAGRDLLLGALRSTWARLHAKTGDVAHLCAWRSTLRLHLEALAQALGSSARPEDTAGLYQLLDEADATLARGAPVPCDPPSLPPEQSSSPPNAPASAAATTMPPEPLHPPRRTRAPRRTVAGQVLVGLGVSVFLGTGAALGVLGNRYRNIVNLDASLPEGASASPAEADRVRTLERQGERASIAAIMTGVAGAALLATGIGLWVTGRRGFSASTAVAPVVASDLWGIALRRNF